MTNITDFISKAHDVTKEVIDYFFKSKKADQYWEFERSRNILTEEIGHELVTPVGTELLIRLYKKPKKVGSIILTDATRDAEKYNTRIGQVLAMGPEAFYEKVDFPTGTRCQVGDWIILRPYEMSQFSISLKDPGGDDYDLALIFDNKFRAVVTDPSQVNTSNVVGR
jgi:co-chaperonin GroES (HSP10)